MSSDISDNSILMVDGSIGNEIKVPSTKKNKTRHWRRGEDWFYENWRNYFKEYNDEGIYEIHDVTDEQPPPVWISKILSKIDNNPVKFIEVKSITSNSDHCDLSSNEYKCAKKENEKYMVVVIVPSSKGFKIHEKNPEPVKQIKEVEESVVKYRIYI